jgi:pimeloyl-ACP methyl ester carboxylesterase
MPLASLASKPDAPLTYDVVGEGAPLVVFINGLGLPAASWEPAISDFQKNSKIRPQILTFDRYSQGATTTQDPTDNLPGKEPGYGHDFNDAVSDLRELLQAIVPDAIKPLVFVAASIGVHIARLYAAKYSDTVEGLLLLDSNIGNLEYTDFWPNPDAPEFKESEVVSEDCSIEDYRESRAKLGKMFNSDVKNPEGLDRRSVKDLLPDPSTPTLQGADGKGPWLTVVGHDPEQFATESLRIMNTPKSLSFKYTQP